MVDCECIHPLYTDFDHLRQQRIGNVSIAGMKVCNLIQGGKDLIKVWQYPKMIFMAQQKLKSILYSNRKRWWMHYPNFEGGR